MKSFLKLTAESHVKENNLLKVEKIIDWHQLRLVLKKIDRSGLDPAGYDTLKLLKALILQAWYSLSDVDLEESLRVVWIFFYLQILMIMYRTLRPSAVFAIF